MNTENDTRAQDLNSAYLDVAKEQIGRSQARATFVAQAAGAIGTIYTAILGLAFGFIHGSEKPVPATGIIPAIFIGLALVLAGAYACSSYIVEKPASVASDPSEQALIEQRNAFIVWTSKIVTQRLYFLHASLISLGFGVIFLPAAFLSISEIVVWIIAFLLFCSIPVIVLRINKPQRNMS
jgi:hypothetical protein